MMLCRVEIQDMMADGVIEITPEPQAESFQPASVDLRLGYTFVGLNKVAPIDLRKPDPEQWREIRAPLGQPVTLPPGDFVLASTLESIKLGPRIAAEICNKSTVARSGLVVEAAGFVDPGFSGCLTLELKNNTVMPIVMYPGDYICQIKFYELSREATDVYQGRYANKSGPVPPARLRRLEILE